MSERLVQRVFLAIACCIALVWIPLPQALAQTSSGDSVSWRDANGNIHYPDEDGNYMINSKQGVTSGPDVPINREKAQSTTAPHVNPELKAAPSSRDNAFDPSRDVQSDLNQDLNLNQDVTLNLPRTAGELPVLSLIGMLSIAGAATTRLVWNLRR